MRFPPRAHLALVTMTTAVLLSACEPSGTDTPEKDTPQADAPLSDAGLSEQNAHRDAALAAAQNFKQTRSASDEARARAAEAAAQRLETISVPDGVNVEVWADETDTLNPTFFSFDSQGRMLMIEMGRVFRSVKDVRGFSPEMTLADIQIRSNEERLQMYKDFQAEHDFAGWSEFSDQIVLLEDRDKDGRAETSTLFSGGYNDPLDGLASGVIERDGKVYFTNIPHLWLLEDRDGDGVAEYKESLQDGFGIRVGFLGHDMHGMIWGPDGKLYWSIGDRGYQFTTREGVEMSGQNMGSVFRMNPDGSELELFYTGLRNPQELVFDDYGNLFTADNDGDGGDMERINHLIEGGDSGWHGGHQSIMSFTERLQLRSGHFTAEAKIPNAWMTQDMWKPRNHKQPAFMLPGIGQIDGGPSGFVYNPGASFGERWEDHFFVIHFLGARARTNISSFQVKPNGAGFTMENQETFSSGINAVDLDFGPDGRLYISEFNFGGWGSTDEGSIYAMSVPGATDSDTVRATEALLTSDFDAKAPSELAALLSHHNQRVRQRAQFSLAKLEQGSTLFRQVASDTQATQLARIHSIWGLGQIAQKHQRDTILGFVQGFLSAEDTELRAQAARVLGDHRYAPAAEALTNALADSNARVAMYAAIGIGRIGHASAVDAVLARLEANADADLWLRHGLVMALQGIDKSQWLPHANHEHASVRMGVLLALRHQRDADIARFLSDRDPALVAEAIIAINDADILEARPQLAAHLDTLSGAQAQTPSNAQEAFLHHRVINANFNIGDEASAKRILAYAQSPNTSDRLMSEALAALQAWDAPNPIDSTTGLPSNASSERAEIHALVTDALPYLLANSRGQALVQSMQLAQSHSVEIPTDILIAAARNADFIDSIRVQALDNLQSRDDHGVLALVDELTQGDNIAVGEEALGMLIHRDANNGVSRALQWMASGATQKQQAALRQLQGQSDPRVDSMLRDALALRLDQPEHSNPGMWLELIELARSRDSEEVQALVSRYDATMQQAPVMTRFAGALEGGNAKRGQELFHTGGAGECLRCHKVNGTGADVGPDLSQIGAQRSGEYLLAALVDPSADIAPGYGTLKVTLHSGEEYSGIYMGETDTTLTLRSGDGEERAFETSALASVQRPVSGMPPMHYLLKPKEIRDIVAYLRTLKGRAPQPESH